MLTTGIYLLLAQAAPPAVVAGIPVNYEEAKAAFDPTTLPDPLRLANGKRVTNAKTWHSQRRPEIVRLYEENQFGRSPGRPAQMTFDVFEKSAPAFEGKAIRRQVTIRFSPEQSMDLVLYLPPKATKPVPVLLHLGFTANSSAIADPGIKPGQIWNREKQRVAVPAGGRFRTDVIPVLEKGFGFASIYYGDIDPDFDGGVPLGVRSLYPKPAGGDWGSIAAWAWGLSRAMDYLETDQSVDAKRVAIMGVSRLGKTVLWAGANDPRFAMVIASCSGEGGAAIARRNYGETAKHMAARFGYQFAPNYANWGDRVAEMPVDANLLVSLIAPRPLLLQTGDTDFWSDPKGEFLAAVAAGPVYRLLGAQDLGVAEMPKAGEPVLKTLGYYMHAGGHGSLPGDWAHFLNFMDLHFNGRKQ